MTAASGSYDIEAAATEALAEILREIAADPAQRVYAIIDGAHFENLPRKLRNAGLRHLSLYPKVADRSLVMTGHWLVDPYHALPEETETDDGPEDDVLSDEALEALAAYYAQEMKDKTDAGDEALVASPASTADATAQMEALLAIVSSTPGAVFWAGDASLSEESLYRHLRTINKILIPRKGAEDAIGEEYGHEMVLFRHGDANVMAQFLPALDKPQLSRLFGPATQILFTPENNWGGRVKRAVRADDLPKAPTGPLRIDSEAMRAISACRMTASRRKIMTYLRKVAPDETKGLDDEALHKRVFEFEQSGRELGLRSERAHGKWAYLMLSTDGEFGQGEPVREALTQAKGGNADRALDRIMNIMVKLEKNDRGGPA
ncbi:hypothetical protein ABFT80_14015 [Mesorhizobium sp. SB112]|uniref:DUF4123 domain-containing protein n=1 Tax=Mesorhizobium sp. SB112 TaxID=3151853 RepID=UPI003264F407